MRGLVLAIAPLLVACDNSVPIDELDDAIVDAFCKAYVECGLIDDMSTCRKLDFEISGNDELVAAVKNGTVIYHEEQTRACLAALTGQGCSRGRFLRESVECSLAFEGTVGDGGACTLDEQCISQQCNIVPCPEACCPGTCAGDTPPATPGLGESCAGTARCAEGFCDDATQVCTPLRAPGESCQSNEECREGTCNGTCVTLPGPGETCTPEASPACDQLGNYCSPTTMTCTPLGLSGDPCTTVADCSPLYACSDGQCTLGALLGDPCTADGATVCIDRSWCDPETGRCAAPQPDGEPCSLSSQCVGRCNFDTGLCETEPVCI